MRPGIPSVMDFAGFRARFYRLPAVFFFLHRASSSPLSFMVIIIPKIYQYALYIAVPIRLRVRFPNFSSQSQGPLLFPTLKGWEPGPLPGGLITEHATGHGCIQGIDLALHWN